MHVILCMHIAIHTVLYIRRFCTLLLTRELYYTHILLGIDNVPVNCNQEAIFYEHLVRTFPRCIHDHVFNMFLMFGYH